TSETRFPRAGSASYMSSSSTAGTICQRRPNRSMSQPHACGLPPPSSSAFQAAVPFGLVFALHDHRDGVIRRSSGATTPASGPRSLALPPVLLEAEYFGLIGVSRDVPGLGGQGWDTTAGNGI